LTWPDAATGMRLLGDQRLGLRLAMSLWLSQPLPKLAKTHNNKHTRRIGLEGYGQKGLFVVNPFVVQLPGWNDAVWSLPLALDSKAGEGLCISINPEAEPTTIYMNAGVVCLIQTPGTGD